MTTSADDPAMTVLVYSDNAATRAAVRLGVGRRPASDVPRVEFVECATPAAVIARMDAGGIDVAVLDGEATPAGGMGVCRQLKDEVYQCPPVLVLLGRPQDAWLATWSRADGAVSHPLDPVAVGEGVAELMRRRSGHESHGALSSPAGRHERPVVHRDETVASRA